MNIPDRNEIAEKERRVKAYLDKNGYDAMVIGRQDNFAWFTDGGNNKVIIPSEAGFPILIVTKTAKYMIAQVMDGARIMDEELSGLDIEYIPLRWYEQSREEKAAEMLKCLKVISDMPIQGMEYGLKEIYKLHYPLTGREIERLRWLGAKTEEILAQIAYGIRPGMTEHEVEAMLLYEFGKSNISPDVLLVGSDERISKYRHPNPSDKKIGRYVLLHPAAKKWGLHANVTRLVYFGDSLPLEIADKYTAACTIEAAAILMCKQGTRFSDILTEEKRLYRETGFENEWKNHFVGGINGYMVADPTLCMDERNAVQINQSFDWFITITGVKVEELSACTKKGREVLSAAGKWPVKEYEYRGDSIGLPEILMR